MEAQSRRVVHDTEYASLQQCKMRFASQQDCLCFSAMFPSSPQSPIWKLLDRTQFRLYMALVYVVALIGAGLAGWVKTGRLLPTLTAVLIAHASFSLIFAAICCGVMFWGFFFLPFALVALPSWNHRATKYVKRFKQNVQAEAVVILGHPDWFVLDGWLKPIYGKSEMKALVRYLQAKRQDFSFYPKASRDDVERIMGDSAIREVYFWGHGESHGFELITGEILYYCEFNEPKYAKDFVHQVHCGTRFGKGLKEYIVPPENRDKCFFFPNAIYPWTIIREFKRRTKELESAHRAEPRHVAVP